MASAKRTCLIAGGAGFLGSHLCDALLSEGYEVICVDNFRTGRHSNLKHLCKESRLKVIEADVIDPLVPLLPRDAKLNWIFNLASAASPPHYQSDPEHTMLTNVIGT